MSEWLTVTQSVSDQWRTEWVRVRQSEVVSEWEWRSESVRVTQSVSDSHAMSQSVIVWVKDWVRVLDCMMMSNLTMRMWASVSVSVSVSVCVSHSVTQCVCHWLYHWVSVCLWFFDWVSVSVSHWLYHSFSVSHSLSLLHSYSFRVLKCVWDCVSFYCQSNIERL